MFKYNLPLKLIFGLLKRLILVLKFSPDGVSFFFENFDLQCICLEHER